MASLEPGPTAWIGVRNATLRFGLGAALNAIDFRVDPGEFHSLVGNHNDGKTCLCKLLAGIIRPDAGEIWIDGTVRPGFSIRDAARLGIEYVDGTGDVFPHLSALENVVIGSYGAARGLLARPAADPVVSDWLVSFGLDHPERPASARPHEDRLLIRILGRLYKNPRLLILDEVLEQFTHNRRDRLLAELRARIDAGMSVVWATHKLEEVMDLSDRVTVVRNGRRYLTVASGEIDRRSLIRMAYSSTRDHPGDSSGDFENYYNLIRYSEVLLENLPVAVIITDAEERIRFINAAGMRLFSLAGKCDPGLPLGDVLSNDNAPILDAVRVSLVAGSGRNMDGVTVAAGRGRMLADVQILVVADGARSSSVMLVIEDVSEREAMRRQLTIAHNLSSIGMLAAGVAHEVNNPLESIGNYISYLLRREEDSDARDILIRVQKESGYIRDIVTNLVMFSGKGDRKGQDIDLVEMTRDIVRMLGFNAKYDDIEIECRLPDRPLVLDMDPNDLRQVILNLMRNGMEAMPGGGAIVVAAEDAGGGACRLSVRDYGPGLPSTLGHDNDVFLPFVSGKSGEFVNQGLGLSIVYGVMKKWGGSIAVERMNPGTRFIIDLPLAAGEG